jgi:cytochrome P450
MTNPVPRAADAYRPSADDPYPALAALRSRAPVAPWDGEGAWGVTSFSAAQHVLRSGRFAKGPPDSEGAADAVPISVLKQVLRQERVHRLRAELGLMSDALAQECAERQTFDVVCHLAYPLTTGAICSLLEVPARDRPMVMPWARQLAPLFDSPQPAQVAALQSVLLRFQSYFSALAAERRGSPGNDAISDLLIAGVPMYALLQAVLFLFLAGQETTMNLIGNGIYALVRHPDELARLRSDPGLTPSAVEELLRYDPPLQRNVRVAQVDTELGGIHISAGDVVYILVGGANRDPLHFDQPDVLNLSRERNRHLTFGYGPYFCYGAMLARLETSLAIRALLRYIPWLEYAKAESCWRAMVNFRGMESLELSPPNG